MNKKKLRKIDKNRWEESSSIVDKLAVDGVQVFPPIYLPLKFIDEEKEYELPLESQNRNLETPVQEIDEKNPAGTILKRDKDLVITPLTHAEYEKELKKPTLAFVCNIVFPKTLEEVLEFSNRGAYNVEDILYENVVTWTVPNWAKLGDIAFFMFSKTSIQTIRKLCTQLLHSTGYSEEKKAQLKEWLDIGRNLYNEYGGKIYAYGRVSGNPSKLDDDELNNLHWKARIYAEIEDICVLDNPIDISEFNSFLYISRTGSITPVYGDAFERLKRLILEKNNMAAEYFVDSVAAPVPLARINDDNWLSVANDYRRSFLLELQFRSFYVDRFLCALGDQKKLYRECRVKKQGIPDSFVDNIILFNGKYLPVEVKLNIENEVDLPGQVRKYCNDDARFADNGADKSLDNKRSYLNQVLIIDTEAVYIYDDRFEEINKIKNLDEITVVDDIHELRKTLIPLLKD